LAGEFITIIYLPVLDVKFSYHLDFAGEAFFGCSFYPVIGKYDIIFLNYGVESFTWFALALITLKK
jgi:hypothetical protein